MSRSHNSYDRGLQAEEIAKNYLLKKGYSCLQQRYKTPYGEIDLLMQQDDYLIAVEVKARKTLEDALHAITPKSQQRIQNAMRYYLAEALQTTDAPVRFDVVAVVPPLSVHHLDNAW